MVNVGKYIIYHTWILWVCLQSLLPSAPGRKGISTTWTLKGFRPGQVEKKQLFFLILYGEFMGIYGEFMGIYGEFMVNLWVFMVNLWKVYRFSFWELSQKKWQLTSGI